MRGLSLLCHCHWCCWPVDLSVRLRFGTVCGVYRKPCFVGICMELQRVAYQPRWDCVVACDILVNHCSGAMRVAPGQKALALSVLATGYVVGMVLGVPLGRLVGQWFWLACDIWRHWVLALVVFVQTRLLPTAQYVWGSFRKIPELLKTLYWSVMLAYLLVFTAHYTAWFLYRTFMRQVGSISENFSDFCIAAIWYRQGLLVVWYLAAGVISSILGWCWYRRYCYWRPCWCCGFLWRLSRCSVRLHCFGTRRWCCWLSPCKPGAYDW